MPDRFESPPELHTPRLILQPLSLACADDFFALSCNEEVMRYASLPPQTREASDAMLRDWLDECRRGKLCSWIVRDRQDRFAGQVSLFGIDRSNLRAEIGYLLMPAFWGQGYATETVGAAVRYAFDHLGLCRLEADVDPDNTGSWRVLEKNGFVREGIMPKRWYKEGRFFDTWYYGLLNDRRIRELGGSN